LRAKMIVVDGEEGVEVAVGKTGWTLAPRHRLKRPNVSLRFSARHM
jgi:hypothetical protein